MHAEELWRQLGLIGMVGGTAVTNLGDPGQLLTEFIHTRWVQWLKHDCFLAWYRALAACCNSRAQIDVPLDVLTVFCCLWISAREILIVHHGRYLVAFVSYVYLGKQLGDCRSLYNTYGRHQTCSDQCS